MEADNNVTTDIAYTSLLYGMMLSLADLDAPLKLSTAKKNIITSKTKLWETLDNYIKRNGSLGYHAAHRLAICMGIQLSALTELGYGLAFLDLSDIIVIDKDWFLLANLSQTMPLVEGSMIKILTPPRISKNKSSLIAPELASIKKLPIKVDQSCGFYSVGSLCLLAMGLNTSKSSMSIIYPSPLYFLIERCIVKEPKNRIFLHV